jgi:hypothetical protein
MAISKSQKIHLCPHKGQQQMFCFSKCPRYFNLLLLLWYPPSVMIMVFFYKSKTPVNFYVVQHPWAKAFLKDDILACVETWD